MACEAASNSAGPGDKTRIIEPPAALALSPERGAMPRIVAAVPERIQEHYIGRAERGIRPRYPGPGLDDPAGEVPGEVAGDVATGDGRGPVEAGAVVASAGDEGANDALLNGGRCAVMATMR
jgi:hypothetical protein